MTQWMIHSLRHSGNQSRGALPSAHLHRYAMITAIATFVLLIAGGLVTSTDSGLAVPDWPLSYGMWFPPMVGGIRYEHGHRMIAGVVGIMILFLAVWTARVESRRWVRRLAYGALGALILQALLGGLTVLLLLPSQVSIAHACLGQAVFCLVAARAYGTAPGWAARGVIAATPGSGAIKRLSLIVALLATAQLLVGAVIRHTGYLVIPHLIIAGLLVLHVGLLARRAAGASELRGHVWRLAALVAAQVSLGFVVFWHRGWMMPRTAHMALGALVLAQAAILAWETHRVARLS